MARLIKRSGKMELRPSDSDGWLSGRRLPLPRQRERVGVRAFA